MQLVGFIIRIYHDTRSPERQIIQYFVKSAPSLSLRTSEIDKIYTYTLIRRLNWNFCHQNMNFCMIKPSNEVGHETSSRRWERSFSPWRIL